MPTRSTRRSAVLAEGLNASETKKLNEGSKHLSASAPQRQKVPKKGAPIGKTSKVTGKEAEPADLAVESISNARAPRSSTGKTQAPKTPVNVGKKRKRNAALEAGDIDYSSDVGGLPHNIGSVNMVKNEPAQDQEAKPSVKKRAKDKQPVKEEEIEPQSDEQGVVTAASVNTPVSTKATPKKQSARTHDIARKPTQDAKSPTKKETYGLSEGVSPFANYERPTPEECYEIAKLLQKAHPNCHPRPKTIPEPSQVVAGCGNVPSILDAMIRTLLSAATNGRNSSNAYQGMIKRYGKRQEGIGKGSVDYNAVRLAPQADLEKAIASGGLAKNKSKNIKAILDMVYDENQQRKRDILDAMAAGKPESGPAGFMQQSDEQKSAEIAVVDENVLSLDHLHYLPTYAAISQLTKYPGIGVKTAACVALFCMQRDCFAVDTHVFRLCKWLGWVPDQSAPDYVKAKGEPRVDRDPTFSHLEVRIPDELKYNLHQLFIQHGKKCGRCRGNTSESHPEWAKGCPIENFVDRRGPRKGGNATGKAKKPIVKSGKKRKQASEEVEESDEEEVEMSDLVEDEDDEEVEEAMPDLDDDEEFNIPSKTARQPRLSTGKKTRATKTSGSTPVGRTSAKKAARN